MVSICHNVNTAIIMAMELMDVMVIMVIMGLMAITAPQMVVTDVVII